MESYRSKDTLELRCYYHWYFKNLIEGVHVISSGGNFCTFLHISASFHICDAILIGSE